LAGFFPFPPLNQEAGVGDLHGPNVATDAALSFRYRLLHVVRELVAFVKPQSR
jgi:hypothetical protein